MKNRLAESSSPYLLQHAGNPVHWQPWDAEALETARRENKPILLSIGYSACHWCHVMEHNCFENKAIAEVMNQFFICIKVDREERPDVDTLYMDALHLMGLRGGWPLNVFLTPDQLPFYGGTYFPPEQWMNILQQIARAHAEKAEELQEIGLRNQQGLAISDHQRFSPDTQPRPIRELIAAGLELLEKNFDSRWGGFGSEPKFPMPCVYRYLLHLSTVYPAPKAREMALFSLKKMALGGIHDQLGGGFARYSVDEEWRIPHFEKMLYDNAQLLSLYSIAWQETGELVFRRAADGINRFVSKELSHPAGGFFSALDADSEGIEGKFYVWTKEEVATILGDDFDAFARFYDLSEEGNFEHGLNVIRSLQTEEDFLNLLPAEMQAGEQEILKRCRKKLEEFRTGRIRPGLDDKIICSWNALMISGLCDAYQVIGDEALLERALEAGRFLKEELFLEQGGLMRIWKNGQSHTAGFLDDYAHAILAFTDLSEATLEDEWLNMAERLSEFTIRHFYDPEDGLFFYTPDFGEKLAARKKESGDNVIPSSNAQMAMALNRLGRLLHRDEWMEMSAKMIRSINAALQGDLRYVSQWMQVILLHTFPPPDMVLYGNPIQEMMQAWRKPFIPGKSIRKANPDEVRQAGFSVNKTIAMVCSGTHCLSPADNSEELAGSLRAFRMY